MTEGEEVRFNVKMPKELREDAKRNTQRGELSQEVREVFRRKAYGMGSEGVASELDQALAELEEVRVSINKAKLERDKINAKITSKEKREARLEERVERLRQEREEMNQVVNTIENMLQEGDRMFPTRIKNAADVDESTAVEIHQELKDRNPDLPDVAFQEPGIHAPTDWKDAI